MNPVELILAAAAYRLLRDNIGRSGMVFGAAARVYWLSYNGTRKAK